MRTTASLDVVGIDKLLAENPRQVSSGFAIVSGGNACSRAFTRAPAQRKQTF
jgi:hypothetical protein